MPNTMKLSRIHLLLAILYSVGGIGVAFAVGMPSGDPGASLYVLLLLSIPVSIHLLCRWGVRKEKTWAKHLSGFVAFLLLFGFPLGTVIGVHMLFLLRGWPVDAGKQVPSNS